MKSGFIPHHAQSASIHLLKQLESMETWRQLTRHYSEMSNGALIALAEDFRDLTDVARQVLRDEMRKRNLGDPQFVASALSGAANDQRDPSGGEVADRDATSPDEFVWENVLCESYGRQEAWQISEVLRRAGIESWLDVTPMYLPPVSEASLSRQCICVLVASDCLYEPRHPVASRPARHCRGVESRRLRLPIAVCPRCGAPDPLLEGVDPSNCWKCEVCGRQWTETVEPIGEPPLGG